ncbi:MAG: NAD(P)H-binding protein [Myxococcota bacterium]
MFAPSKPPERPLRIAMAGASGFVGTALRRALGDRHRIVSLTRSPNAAAMGEGQPNEEWRHCDLFSLPSVTDAMEGAEVGIYLVHSMLPSSRLSQGSFEDFDLILADNFARAAKRHGVRQILYVGGLIPPDQNLSKHLRSRLEVEETLGSTGVPVTSLRAALIAGPGGSSLEMLVKLVGRLPMMLLPRWTQSRTQPIALRDVVRAVEVCLDNPKSFDQVFDIGGPDVMTYRDMIQKTAMAIGRRRRLINVPMIPTWISRGWVAMITGASSALTGPLIESLRHNMTVDENPLQRYLASELQPFDQALRDSLTDGGTMKPNPRDKLRLSDDRVIRRVSVARSVQRLTLPARHRAAWVAQEYMRWLPRFVWPFLRVRIHGEVVHFEVNVLGLRLLELTYDPADSDDGRQTFTVSGGLLARPRVRPFGRLEFREVLDRRHVMSAVHDFSPRLPWYVYNATQAIAHLLVMWGFGRHLARVALRSDEPAQLEAGPAPSVAEAPDEG